MAKAAFFATELLELLLNNVPLPGLGNAAGILGSGVGGFGYVGLHTASLAGSGTQSSAEILANGYQRIAVARNPTPGSKLWICAGGIAANNTTLEWATFQAGTPVQVVNHVSFGKGAAGDTDLMLWGPLPAGQQLTIGPGSRPRFSPGQFQFGEA